MKICYLILAHNNPLHFKSLVNTLSTSHSDVYIHLDAKSRLIDFQAEVPRANVVFINDRVRVSWGGWSLVKATLNLIDNALGSGKNYDYYFLLSGSDYPIKSQTYIENVLEKNNGKEFISVVKIPNKLAQKPIGRFTKYHIDIEYYSNNIVTRKIAEFFSWLIKKMKIKRRYDHILQDGNPYGGSQWWALTDAAVRHIKKFTAANRKFVRFFRYAYIPDESFFQMIIKNSVYKDNIARNFTFADWSRDEPPYPSIIDFEHLHKFKKDGNEFVGDVYGNGEILFARKFPDNSEELRDFIHKEIW